MVLDTNIVLFHAQSRLATPLATGNYAVSVITEIEILSFPHLSATEEQHLRQMLASDLAVIALTDSIKARTIKLRRQTPLKLPDAIIAATAIELGVELLTNDLGFKNIPGLACRNLPLSP